MSAGISLAVYLTAALVYPELHRLHHAQHGADHVHGALGTTYFHDEPGAAGDERSVFDHHRAFDADWAYLDLADVAHAGTITVDCELAPYTGVECTDARAEHAHNFGDELLARQQTHHRHPPDVDPEHGAGSFEHLAASLLTARPVTLPPPPSRRIFHYAQLRPVAPCVAPVRKHPSRGPPVAC